MVRVHLLLFFQLLDFLGDNVSCHFSFLSAWTAGNTRASRWETSSSPSRCSRPKHSPLLYMFPATGTTTTYHDMHGGSDSPPVGFSFVEVSHNVPFHHSPIKIMTSLCKSPPATIRLFTPHCSLLCLSCRCACARLGGVAPVCGLPCSNPLLRRDVRERARGRRRCYPGRAGCVCFGDVSVLCDTMAVKLAQITSLVECSEFLK